MATSPTYPTATGPISIHKRLADSDSTNLVDIYDNSLGTSAIKIEALSITTDNSADRIARLHLNDGSIAYLMGSVTVPDLSGTNGVTDARINVLATLGVAGADGVLCIWVPAGKKLQIGLDAALASGKFLYVTGRAITYS